MLKDPFAFLKNVRRKAQTRRDAVADAGYKIAFKYPASMLLFNPNTGVVWHASETINLNGIKVLVHSDHQANWVKRTNGVPVIAKQESFPEVPKVKPKVHFFDIVESTQDKTKSEVLEQSVSQ